MAVTAESIYNFQIARVGDVLTGVQDQNSFEIHLALSEPRHPSPSISLGRYSTVNGQLQSPFPGGGGHSALASTAGMAATQVGPGSARGEAAGFAIRKTNYNEYEIASWRAGFNIQPQFQDTRPPGSNFPRELGMDFRGPITDDLDAALLPLQRRRYPDTRERLRTVRRTLGGARPEQHY